MAVRSIRYNEGGEPDLGYEFVEVTYGKKRNVVKFDSGNFVKDWFDSIRWIIESELLDEPLMHSSTVDHFIMDGGGELYDSAYLQINNDIPELVYYYSEYSFEFFVPIDTNPTWKELIEICK